MSPKEKTKAVTWRKSSPDLVAVFEEMLTHAPGAERKFMFGFPCGFFQGNMFTGLFEDHLFFRLNESDRKTFLQVPGAASFEPIKGRPMREYVTVPASMLKDENILLDGLGRSLKYVGSLPSRQRKK